MLHRLSVIKWIYVPVSISSPTNIFAIPDTTIVIGIDIFALPVMLVSNCIDNTEEESEQKLNYEQQIIRLEKQTSQWAGLAQGSHTFTKIWLHSQLSDNYMSIEKINFNITCV